MQDWQLLRQYVDGSDASFAQLARRYTNLVYATCRREVGDSELAEDVAQAVFLLLARKAPSLRHGTILAGWLFQTSVLASRNALRDERRRRLREQKAVEYMDDDLKHRHNATWDEIETHFNEAMLALKSGEREAILLRLCDDLSLRETGEALGVSEDAARMRVTRGIEKIRSYLVKHGVTVSAVGLSTLVSAHLATAAAPAACVARITVISSYAAGHATTVAASAKAITIAQGVYRTMIVTNLKVAAAVTCGLVLAGGTVGHFVLAEVRQTAPATTLKMSPTDFHNGWMHDYDYNFTAKQFNGSKRYSIPDSEVTAEALQLGKDYTTVIYPAIRRSYLKDGKLPTAIDSISELRTYYSTHPKWSAIASSRLDGTMISRPLYVDNPPDAPHDPWSAHPFYLPGKTHPLYVYGWDDGRVTFNSMGDLYLAFTHTSYGSHELEAPPGAAGIPPDANQNNKRFGPMR